MNKPSADAQPPPSGERPDVEPKTAKKHSEVQWLLREAQKLMDDCLTDGIVLDQLPCNPSIDGVNTHRTLVLSQVKSLFDKIGVFQISINGDVLIRHAGEDTQSLSEILPTIGQNPIHMTLYRETMAMFERFENVVLRRRKNKGENFPPRSIENDVLSV